MTISFFQDFISPGSLYYHSVFGYMTHLQPDHPLWYLIPAGLIFTLTVVTGIRPTGRRWSFWFLLLAMPGLPIIIAYARNYTLAERHLLFCIPLFMAYWGAAVTSVISRLSSFSGKGPAQEQPR